ncbi:MAG TPA: hypothetical protein VFR98_04465 [Agromyces sp.]|nr:hypothetical protein [Agromyces sp.]
MRTTTGAVVSAGVVPQFSTFQDTLTVRFRVITALLRLVPVARYATLPVKSPFVAPASTVITEVDEELTASDCGSSVSHVSGRVTDEGSGLVAVTAVCDVFEKFTVDEFLRVFWFELPPRSMKSSTVTCRSDSHARVPRFTCGAVLA